MLRALKPLDEQVIVITGATSGVGLATARAAAARGASLVVAARGQEALRELVEELRAKGARAEGVVADVGDPDQVRGIVAAADTVFGGFDTWVNDAGVAIYGRIEETPLSDQRKLFETDYWGVVHGSLAAIERLKGRQSPSALINVASVLSDQAMPLQGVYSAAKHAVKGFTNALRMETLAAAPQISITLIKPSALDTPYKEHARNLTGHPATNPPPVYDPALAAEAILYAAEHRTREITVGGAGRALALFGQLLPAVAEPTYAILAPLLQRDRTRRVARADNLEGPGRDLSERTGSYAFVRRSSLWTKAQMNPEVTTGVLAGLAAAIWLTLTARHGLEMAGARRRARLQEREKWRAREDKLRKRLHGEGTRRTA